MYDLSRDIHSNVVRRVTYRADGPVWGRRLTPGRSRSSGAAGRAPARGAAHTGAGSLHTGWPLSAQYPASPVHTAIRRPCQQSLQGPAGDGVSISTQANMLGNVGTCQRRAYQGAYHLQLILSRILDFSLSGLRLACFYIWDAKIFNFLKRTSASQSDKSSSAYSPATHLLVWRLC